MMNVFRLTGDLLHVLAIILLLFKIFKTRSCSDVSGKSQILLTLVYSTRYLDLFTYYISLYNTFMKIAFLATSYVTLCLIHVEYSHTYDRKRDTFLNEFIIIPLFGVALTYNHSCSLMEVLWTFSIYLEAVALLPQLILICKTRKADKLLSYYLLTLGLYRAFYLLNWEYRYLYEDHYDLIAIGGGVVQTILVFLGIAVLYCSGSLCKNEKRWNNEKFCIDSGLTKMPLSDGEEKLIEANTKISII